MKAFAVAALVGLLATGCTSRTSSPVAPEATATTTETTTSTDGPPAAADGTNVAACADGDCEVAVSGQVELIVGSTPVSVIVAGESVTLNYALKSGTLGSTGLSEPGASGGWGDAVTGQNTDVTLVGIDATTAVLKFETA